MTRTAPDSATGTARAPIDSSLTPLIRLMTIGGRIGCQALSRIVVEGGDELPRQGPLILASNHASNLDVPVIGSWLIPRLGRRIHWLGKKELFGWPIIGWLAANGGVHPVDRGAADVEAFRLAQRILDGGHVLFVFPEGTRSPDGALQAARDGIALLARRGRHKYVRRRRQCFRNVAGWCRAIEQHGLVARLTNARTSGLRGRRAGDLPRLRVEPGSQCTGGKAQSEAKEVVHGQVLGSQIPLSWSISFSPPPP